MKYAILDKNGVSNSAPTNNSLGITHSLARFLYQIGIGETFDYGEYVFEQILKQAESFVVKLPIDFPSFIYGILIKQNPVILSVEDISSVNPNSLNFSYRLFARNPVPDIVFPIIQNFDITYLTTEGKLSKVPPMSGTSRGHVL